MSKVGFPTVGEIVKYLFDNSGILATSGDGASGFKSDTEKKTFQRTLKRLSDESSELNKNLTKVLETFVLHLSDIAPCDKVTALIENGIFDCFAQYIHLVSNEGTYLSKRETVKWLISTKLINRICLSHQKLYYKFNLHDQDLILPEEPYWFLPNRADDGAIVWPIAKTFQWIYDTAGTSRTRFHFPNKTTQVVNARYEQNLENAYHWISGKPSRSWLTVKKNLLDSFEALEKYPPPNHIPLDEKTKEGMLFAVFMARFTTSVCQNIQREFGEEFLFSCVFQYKQRDTELVLEHKPLVELVNRVIQEREITNYDDIDVVWFQMADIYWKEKAELIARFGKYIESYIVKLNDQKGLAAIIPQEVRDKWVKIVGPYIVNSLVDQLAYNANIVPDASFMRLVLEGEALRKASTTNLSDIDQFEAEVKEHGLTGQISWLVAWMRASVHYHNEAYERAHEYYCEAFENGKYVAGNKQYLLVNQYVESCAKNDEWVRFKKGLAWATYLGIPVRWIRDEPESPKTLKYAYAMLKMGTYVQI